MEIVSGKTKNLERAVKILEKGGLVIFPTETVYGLGANGLDAKAAAAIFEAKKRPAFNPLILHLSSIDEIEKYCNIKNDKVFKLAEKFWPGPLTMVLPKKEIVPEIITAGHRTVAVRVPAHPVAVKLLNMCGFPVAAPSANMFGFLSPTSVNQLSEELITKVGLVLDGGKSKVGIESTIISVFDDKISMLRPGGIDLKKIEEITGKLYEPVNSDEKAPLSPGRLPYHYSPGIPLKFLNEKNLEKYSDKKKGALFFREPVNTEYFTDYRVLSPDGDLHEAAANLFEHLHYLENSGVEIILAEKIIPDGLGYAIMDRLNKAAKRFDI